MTNPHCECPVAGYCNRHQMQKGPRSHQHCRGTSGTRDGGLAYWNAWEQGRLGATAPAVPVLNPEGFAGVKTSPPKASSTPARKSTGCCGGAVTKTVSRLKRLKDAAVDFWNDGMVVATEQQQADRLSICGGCPLNVNGWCDDSRGGCGCNLALKVKARAAYCPVGKWFAYRDDYRPAGTPKRSLVFHLYPKLGAEWNWLWHIEQIRKYAHIFNDKIVIGVGVGRETATIEKVQDLFKGIPVTHWFRADNDQLAETNTHIPMMTAVQTDDPDAVVFRYHAKGVTKQPGSVEQPWAELLWQVSMDLPSVDDALRSHLTCGAMRSMEPLVKSKPGAFFFAGSAYWFRAKEAFERDWQHTDKTRWWVEYMPSHLFSQEESACLLYDLTESSVIRTDLFEKHIRPEWDTWKLARGIE